MYFCTTDGHCENIETLKDSTTGGDSAINEKNLKHVCTTNQIIHKKMVDVEPLKLTSLVIEIEKRWHIISFASQVFSSAICKICHLFNGWFLCAC